MDLNSEQQKDSHNRLKQILKPLLLQYIPEYSGGEISMKHLCGMTNQIFRVDFQGCKSVVFRVLSPIVDREVQGLIVKELSSSGVAPKCYFTSLDYRLQEYIQNAYHASPSQIISNPKILDAIMVKINNFHQVKLPETIPHTIMTEQIFTQQSRNKYAQAKPHQSYNKAQFEELKNNLMNQFLPMKEWIHAHFGQTPDKVKFCHNDLNNLNIFVRDLGEADKEAILIDFDYVGYNYAAYDLANFLNETCIQYGAPYPGFKIHKKLSAPQIHNSISSYSTKYPGLEQDIQKMLVFVNYYWALWSLLIKPTSSSPTFCPLQHGIARWKLMNYYKEELKK